MTSFKGEGNMSNLNAVLVNLSFLPNVTANNNTATVVTATDNNHIIANWDTPLHPQLL